MSTVVVELVGVEPLLSGGEAVLPHRDQPGRILRLDGLAETSGPAYHHLLLMLRVVGLPHRALACGKGGEKRGVKRASCTRYVHVEPNTTFDTRHFPARSSKYWETGKNRTRAEAIDGQGRVAPGQSGCGGSAGCA